MVSDLKPTTQKIMELDNKMASIMNSMMNYLEFPRQSYRAVVVKREGGMRHIILLLILLFGLYNLQCNGTKMINLSFVRNGFEWESTDFFNEWWACYSSTQVYLVY